MNAFLGNVVYLSVADMLSKGLNFFAQIYLARRLGVEGFGQINLALALLTYFALITDFNLTTIGTRDVARSKDPVGYASSFVTLRLALSMLAFGLLLVFVFFLPKPPEMKLLIILFGLSLFPSAILLEWFFNGIESMGYLAVSRVIRAAVFLGLLLLAMFLGRLTVYVIALIYAASWLSSMTVQVYWLTRNDRTLRLQYDLDHWRQLLRDAAPLGLSVVMIQVFANLDTVMLGFLKSDQAVGWYSAGYRIVATLVSFASVFVNPLYPVLARHSASPDELRRVLFSALKLLLFLGLPIAVGGMILGDPLLVFLYGEDYRNSVMPFQVLIWKVLIVYAALPFSYCLYACNKGKEFFYSVAVAACVNPLLNYVLISHYGLVGAAAATLTTDCILLTMYCVFSQRVVSIPVQDLLARPLIASVMMGLAVLSVPVHVVLRIVLGVAVYLCVVLSFKWVVKNDIDRIH